MIKVSTIGVYGARVVLSTSHVISCNLAKCNLIGKCKLDQSKLFLDLLLKKGA